MDTAATAKPNVTRYALPRYLTLIRDPGPDMYPAFLDVDEDGGNVAAICDDGTGVFVDYNYPNLNDLAGWHGFKLDELTAVLSGWTPTHRLTHAGAVYLVMLAGDGTGDAFTGKEWAEGELPEWFSDEKGQWFSREPKHKIPCKRDGVRLQSLA
jgi:hypothetical protein